MKYIKLSLVLFAIVSLFGVATVLAQEEGAEKPARQRGNRGGGGMNIEKTQKRIEPLSAEVAQALGEVDKKDQKAAMMIVDPFTRDFKATSELKKADEAAFNRKVQITVMKLQALALADEVKNSPDNEDAKKKLAEHLAKQLDLEKADMEAAIKALQAKLKEYAENRQAVIDQRVEELTKKKEQPQARKPKEKKEKKEKNPAKKKKKKEAEDEHGDEDGDMFGDE